jgi:hypothetical protein
LILPKNLSGYDLKRVGPASGGLGDARRAD